MSAIGLLVVATVVLTGTTLFSMVDQQTRETRHAHIGKDSLNGNAFEAAVAEVIVDDGGALTSCSATHVGPSGQVLTAVHCFQQPNVCDFDPVVGEFPLVSGTYLVDVMAVNGTTEKWTFEATVLGWSGITDVMVLQLQPLTKADGSIINVRNQRTLSFGSNRQLERGEPARSLSFDLAFLKKMGHSGAVLHPMADRGTSFAVSIEQVFVDLNSEDGSSGSAVINPDGQIIMAPLTYGWTDSAGNIYAVSGTSSDVSGPLVRSILRGDAPNGPANNKYLIPSLGIVPQFTMSGLNVRNFLGSEYAALFENKGFAFLWLPVQGYYEFIANTVYECNFVPYNLTAPSLLDAPLDFAYYGTAPDPFPDFPAINDAIVVLLALERTPNQWVTIGEDAGAETISGIIAGAGKQPGDTIRVRIKSGDPFDLANPNSNWDAVYTVTLQPIDPFWDTVASGPFINVAAFVHVNKTASGTLMHFDATLAKNQLMTLQRPISKPTPGRSIAHARAPMITPAPQGVDLNQLPTLSDLYLTHAGKSKRRRGVSSK